MAIKQRNVGGTERNGDSTKDTSNGSQKKSGPFSGRYNPT